MLVLLALFVIALANFPSSVYNEFANFASETERITHRLKSYTPSSNKAFEAKDLNADFEAFFTTMNGCETMKVPGSAVTVIHEGQTIFQSVIGKSDVENNIDADADTLWGVGSTTKAMTGALLGSLVDDELLDFTTPLNDIFPDWWSTKQRDQNDLTVEDMLLMRSSTALNNNLWFYNISSGPLSDLPGNWKEDFPQQRPFRYEYHYNNFAYALAGAAAEEVGGDSWANLLRNRVLSPLGLNESTGTYVYTREALAADAPHYAHPYFLGDDGNVHAYPVDINTVIDGQGAPCGSVVMSIKSVDTYLKSFQGGFTEILSPEVFDRITVARGGTWPMMLDVPDFKTLFYAYSYGWVLGVYRGEKFFWHNGGTVGHTTMFLSFPQRQLTIGILSNQRGIDLFGHYFFGAYVFDKLFGFEPLIPTEAICFVAAATPVPSFPSGLSSAVTKANKIVGTYSNDRWGQVIVKHNGSGTVSLQLGVATGLLYNQVPGTLEFTWYGENYIEPTPYALKFVNNKLHFRLADEGHFIIFKKQ